MLWCGAPATSAIFGFSSRRDPDFAEKAGRVLDLNARLFEGKRLWPDEYVIGADEKASCKRSAPPRHPAARTWPPDSL